MPAPLPASSFYLLTFPPLPPLQASWVQDAEFFDVRNPVGKKLRHEALLLALDDMEAWLETGGWLGWVAGLGWMEG